MLVESTCPTCGGPAVALGDEISCPLCGNQTSQPDTPETVPSVEIPAVIEFEVEKSLAEKYLAAPEVARAIEYFLGFMEHYDKFPQVGLSNTTRSSRCPVRAEQIDGMRRVCSRYSVSPEKLVGTAVEMYANREDD